MLFFLFHKEVVVGNLLWLAITPLRQHAPSSAGMQLPTKVLQTNIDIVKICGNWRFMGCKYTLGVLMTENLEKKYLQYSPRCNF